MRSSSSELLLFFYFFISPMNKLAVFLSRFARTIVSHSLNSLKTILPFTTFFLAVYRTTSPERSEDRIYRAVAEYALLGGADTVFLPLIGRTLRGEKQKKREWTIENQKWKDWRSRCELGSTSLSPIGLCLCGSSLAEFGCRQVVCGILLHPNHIHRLPH